MDRNAQNGVHQRRHAIARRAKASQAVEFFNVLTRPALLERTGSVLPKHRQRLYPPHRGANQRVGYAVAVGHLAGLWTSSWRTSKDTGASVRRPWGLLRNDLYNLRRKALSNSALTIWRSQRPRQT